MNCSEAMFYENYLTSDFHTNTVISRLFRPVCLLVKMASKTVIRPIRPTTSHENLAEFITWRSIDAAVLSEGCLGGGGGCLRKTNDHYF